MANYVCVTSHAGSYGGDAKLYRAGDTATITAKDLKGRERLWVKVEEPKKKSRAKVEKATAAPGETRDVKVPD